MKANLCNSVIEIGIKFMNYTLVLNDLHGTKPFFRKNENPDRMRVNHISIQRADLIFLSN